MAPKAEREVALHLTDEMLDRAWEALSSWGDDGFTGTIADGQRGCARATIEAAFQGVPLTNYGIGLALASPEIDVVVIYRSSEGVNPPPGALVLVADADDPTVIHSLAHSIDVNLRPGQKIPKRLSISKIEVPR